MLAGIRSIIVVTSPTDLQQYAKLLGDGSRLGLELRYEVQDRPRGVTHGLLQTEKLLSGEKVSLILGDNIFHGSGVGEALVSYRHQKGATMFVTSVRDPSRYGVVEMGSANRPVSIEEKPTVPKSNLAITGLYFFDTDVFDRAHQIGPSDRGELEISELLNSYMKSGGLEVQRLPRGTTWIDAGTVQSLAESSEYIKGVETRHNVLVSSPEEIAWRNGWISDEELISQAQQIGSSEYSKNLLSIISDRGIG